MGPQSQGGGPSHRLRQGIHRPRWGVGRFWRELLGGPIAAHLMLFAGPSLGGPMPPKPLSPECAAAAEASRQQLGQLLAAAPRLDVLLLGEIHTSAADHAWQLATLQALAKLERPLALGLEMVPAARQPILTRLASGQVSEDGFLAGVDWAAIWGHDPELYLPLLRWARQQGVPLLALNVEPEVVRRVRREGLAKIPAAEREGIGIPAPAGATYQKQLGSAWRAHRAMGEGNPLSPGDTKDLERFIASQLLRDRAMAERVAAAHRRDPNRLVVALIGRGHLEHGGVPTQLRELGLVRVLSRERPELPEGCGPPPAGARLGAYLESADGAVWVRRVAPGSASAAAGLQVGDRVLAVNGEPVGRAGQVIRRVRQQPAELPLRLLIQRAGRRLELKVKLTPAIDDSPARMGAIQSLGRSPRS